MNPMVYYYFLLFFFRYCETRVHIWASRRFKLGNCALAVGSRRINRAQMTNGELFYVILSGRVAILECTAKIVIELIVVLFNCCCFPQKFYNGLLNSLILEPPQAIPVVLYIELLVEKQTSHYYYYYSTTFVVDWVCSVGNKNVGKVLLLVGKDIF